MELSKFIDAYLDCGNTLLEAKAKDDIGKYLCMFAGLKVAPTEVEIKASSEAMPLLKGGDGSQAAKYTTKAGKTSVYYMGTGCKPEGGGVPMISFDETDWTALLGRFKEGAELTPGDAPAGSPQEVLDGKQQAKEREQKIQAQADAFGEAAATVLADAGFTGKVQDSTRNLFRQIFGIGGDNAIRKAARKKAGEEMDEAEEDALRYQDALIVNSLVNRVAQISKDVRDGKDLPEGDRKFMRDCLRLRGRGKDRGIYVVPSDSVGDACGGDLMQAGIPFQKGGDRYGVKIGNHNSPIYEAGVWLHEQSLKTGNPLYDEGKPAIFWGGNEASRMHSYRAMDGVLNEYGPKLAQSWIACDRKMPCSAMDKQIEGMLSAEQFNLNLLVFGAEQRNMGTIPDEIQFTDIDGDGNELLLNDIEAAQGEVDGPKALAWYVGSLLNSWDGIVSDPMFAGCDFDVVGRGPTGQQPDGGAVNQDVQVSCGKLAKKLVVNKKNQVESGTGIFGDDEDKNRDHYTGEQATGLNVKTSNDGTDVAYGKRGVANSIDAVDTNEEGVITGFTESTERSRNRHANYLYGVAEQNGQALTEKDKADADAYKMKEINTINDAMKVLAPGGLSQGTVGTVMDSVMGKLGYEEGEKFSNLQKLFTDYQNGDNPSPERTKAEKQIRVTLANAYRNKNQNAPGFRLNMAIEYCQTGMATQNQGFVVTKPAGGQTFVGSESDGIGTAAANIMGYGREGGPAPITSITGTGVNFEGGIGLRRRLKDGVAVQEAVESTDSILPRMRELSGAKAAKTGDSEVGNSAMKAEDFVRQLQELIKRIDKVKTV